jgi:GlpG protein
MRLIGTLDDLNSAQEFSYYLVKEGVQNVFEPALQAGTSVYLIWVVDEDQVDFATQELTAFKADPQNPKYYGHYRTARQVEEAHQEKAREQRAATEEVLRRAHGVRRPGIVTIILIFACIFIFFWSKIETIPLGDHEAILVIRPPTSALLYDFPSPFDLFDQLATRYPVQELQHPERLPPEGRALLNKALSTPWWQGFYAEFVSYLRERATYQFYSGPLFVKIGQGEVWRLFTPALLHYDFLHILFDLIWLYILGTQIESRVGWFRYSCIVLLGAALTNISQYLASGPLFLGMSGVVTTLFGFIWMRQRRAPWEGYELHRVVIAFIVAFIVAMLLFQIVSFGFEVAGRNGIGPRIANTAHLVGLVVGALLGRFDLFAYHEVPAR